MSLCCTATAFATQHLISPGDDWQRLNGKLKPGDEVILMPGKHRSAIFDDLNGTAEQPVIIRGLDPKSPALIQGQRDGLRFNRPHHVVVRNITLSDCGLGGISVSEGLLAAAKPEAAGDVQPLGPFTLSNIKVQRTGLKFERDAMSFIGVDHLAIQDCQFEGWNSCGIELVGCHDVTIDSCTFQSADGFTPQCNIQARAGSSQVQIKRSRFESSARRSISIGGSSKTDQFRPPLAPDNKPGSRAEAGDVGVENCFFINSPVPVAFINAEGAWVRNCTIVRPRGFVMAAISEQPDPRVVPGRSIAFGANLVIWEHGDLHKLVELGKNVPDSAILIESNLWWTTQAATDRAKLGTLPGVANWPQTNDVDPQLDDLLKPQAEAADVFGVDFRILNQKQP